MLPDVIAYTACDADGCADLGQAVGDVQWSSADGDVVQLPTMAEVEYTAEQHRSPLRREDGRPIVIGRDVPSNEQLAIAEASGELIPDTVPDVFGGELVQPYAGHRMLDVNTRGRV